MATIRAIGNKYYAVYRVDGKQVNRATGISVKAAGRKAAQLKIEAQQMADTMERVHKGDTTLQKGIDVLRSLSKTNSGAVKMPTVREYLASFRGEAGEKTESNRRRACGVLLEYLGDDADVRLDALSRETMLDFLRWSLKRVSKGTVGLYKNMLATVFNKAIDDDLLTRSPFPRIVNLERMAKEVNPEIGSDRVNRLPFTREELNTIFTKFPSPWRDVAFAAFALGGQRMGDICLLRWSDINFEKNIVHIETNKTNKELGQPLDARLRTRLISLPSLNAGEEYVFPDLARRYQRAASNISTEFTSLLKAYGIIENQSDKQLKGDRKNVSRKSFHSIRHSFVSLGRCSVGVSPDVMRATVGHDSEEIERSYATANYEQKAAAISATLDVITSDISDKMPTYSTRTA